MTIDERHTMQQVEVEVEVASTQQHLCLYGQAASFGWVRPLYLLHANSRDGRLIVTVKASRRDDDLHLRSSIE